MRAGLRVTEGGSGGPLLVLLHGLGATGDVWGTWRPLLAERWPGRWIAPDLPGHGGSPPLTKYTFDGLAAEVAHTITDALTSTASVGTSPASAGTSTASVGTSTASAGTSTASAGTSPASAGTSPASAGTSPAGTSTASTSPASTSPAGTSPADTSTASVGTSPAGTSPAGTGTRIVALGHSLGGVVGLALTSGEFAVPVQAVIGLGIKVAWTDEDLDRAQAVASRPLAWFATRDEAAARYLRVSGLAGLLSADDPAIDAGLREQDGQWRLAMDPAAFAVGAPDMARLIARSQALVTLARGEHDPMNTDEQLARLGVPKVTLPALGHNAHIENPELSITLLNSHL